MAAYYYAGIGGLTKTMADFPGFWVWVKVNDIKGAFKNEVGVGAIYLLD